jgi:hypothetical protein
MGVCSHLGRGLVFYLSKVHTLNCLESSECHGGSFDNRATDDRWFDNSGTGGFKHIFRDPLDPSPPSELDWLGSAVRSINVLVF